MGNILFRNSDVQTLPEVTKYLNVSINCEGGTIIDGRPIDSGECNCRIRSPQVFEIGKVFEISDGNYKLLELEEETGIYFDYDLGEELLPDYSIPYDTELNITTRGPYVNLDREYCQQALGNFPVRAVFEHTSNSGVKKICNLVMILSK